MTISTPMQPDPVASRDPPMFLCCPIGFCLMADPVLTMDGHSFEWRAIEAWLLKSPISPITGMPLEDTRLVPNYALKDACNQYRLEQ